MLLVPVAVEEIVEVAPLQTAVGTGCEVIERATIVKLFWNTVRKFVVVPVPRIMRSGSLSKLTSAIARSLGFRPLAKAKVIGDAKETVPELVF